MTSSAQKILLPISSQEQLLLKPSTLLAEAACLPVSDVKRAMKKGAVWLTRQGTHKRIRRADTTIKLGDQLGLYYNEAVLSKQVDDCILLHDKQHYSIWFKPAGVLSQGSLWGDHTTINRFVEGYFTPSRPAFIVSRLDKSASGLMIIAHGRKAAAKLSALFEDKKIEKIYCAIVEGEAQHLNALFIDEPIDDKPAQSIVTCLQSVAGRSLVQVDIKTGRKHQIRKHLALINFPIVGDRLHGLASKGDIDLQLRCSTLRFISPFTQLECNYLLPNELQLKLPAE